MKIKKFGKSHRWKSNPRSHVSHWECILLYCNSFMWKSSFKVDVIDANVIPITYLEHDDKHTQKATRIWIWSTDNCAIFSDFSFIFIFLSFLLLIVFFIIFYLLHTGTIIILYIFKLRFGFLWLFILVFKWRRDTFWLIKISSLEKFHSLEN